MPKKTHVVPVTDQTFQTEVAESDTPVLVDFTATWCGPCQSIAPLLETFAAESVGTYKVVKVDIDESPAAVALYKVKSVPTLVAVKGGKETARRVGSGLTKKTLTTLLTK